MSTSTSNSNSNSNNSINCSSCCSNSPSRLFRRKPIWLVEQQQESDGVERHLTLMDLIQVGFGGTIGSGIFVLAGYIAHHFAGPSTCLSFAISGVASLCSGLCFAELAGRIPASGSTYVYTYVAMGELAAVLAAACLTLEYAGAGAAVARSWGDKFTLWLEHDVGLVRLASILNPGYGLSPMGFIVTAASLGLLLNGIKESKSVSNFMTTLKLLLVLFMILGGFCFFQASNLSPFMPFGLSGVMRGATSSFFGYLGYDEVCCIAGESLNPRRDLPRAVLWTLTSVATIYIAAAVALAGMQPSAEVDDTSGFPMAFASNGALWAMQLTAAGEVITLPVVVLLSVMAQPRLQYAMVRDKLLPSIFGQVDEHGNLTSGTWIAGSVMSLVAGCVPFSFLDDLISAGILVSFCMTNSCLVLMRCESPSPFFLQRGLILYNLLCFLTALTFCHKLPHDLSVFFGTLLLLVVIVLYRRCPRSQVFGHESDCFQDDENIPHGPFFESPCVPLIPFFGMFVNWYLIAQLDWIGIVLLVAYLCATGILYVLCSDTEKGDDWNQGQYQDVVQEVDMNGIML